jgi:hypothetical protein
MLFRARKNENERERDRNNGGKVHKELATLASKRRSNLLNLGFVPALADGCRRVA